MNRREFIGWAGLGAIISSMPMAIAACSDAPTTEEEVRTIPATDTQAEVETTDSAANSDGFSAIGEVEELDTVDTAGFISSKDFLGQKVIVIRDPADATALIAVNSVCPHKDCTVDWNNTASEFVCPCHDSKFDTAGVVTGGPADKPLPVYEAKIEGDLVLVKV